MLRVLVPSITIPSVEIMGEPLGTHVPLDAREYIPDNKETKQQGFFPLSSPFNVKIMIVI